MFGVRISYVISLHNDKTLKEMPARINEISVHNFKKLYEAFKSTFFFLRLYMQLTTCIEPATIYNLNSIKVTGVSAAEQKTTVIFSSTLGFLVTSLVLHYRSTTNRCFNNFFFVEKHIPRNSGICSKLTCN